MGGCGLAIRAFAITTAAAFAAAAAEPGPSAPTMPELRIDAAGFDAAEADIRAVVESAARELWRHFPDHRLEPLLVMHGAAGPITLFDRTEPTYPKWREYRDSLRDYADDTMRRWPHVEEIARIRLPAFHARHEARLRANPVDRDLNGSMAVVLLRSFEDTPEHWEAIRWLNERKTEAPRTFDALLADWHAAVPERHRSFVTRIARLFGRSIGSAAP